MPDSTSPLTDGELTALRNRKPDAVRRWIYGNRDYIHSILRRYSSDFDRARDLVQEVFLQALRSLPAFRGNSKITTWLYAIARNVALNHYHEDQRYSYLDEPALETVQATAASEGAVSRNPVAETVKDQKYTLLYEAMEKLSGSYREIIRLRDLQERTTKEVAEQLGLTRVNVRVRLHRARAALREALKPQFEDTYGEMY